MDLWYELDVVGNLLISKLYMYMFSFNYALFVIVYSSVLLPTCAYISCM